jgi:putative heme transporter
MVMNKIRHSRWFVFVYPLVGIVVLDIVYQFLIMWRQADIIARAEPRFLMLAVVNQLAVYLVLVPAMQAFYGATGIFLSRKRAFSMLTMGLAFARIVPAGEYVVWRASLRKYKGSVSATTQWVIMYYTWMFAGLVLLFLVAEILTLAIYPHAHADTLVGKLRFLPVALSIVFLVGLLVPRSPWLSKQLRKVAFDKFGSQAVSPLGIIKDRRLGRRQLGALSFAALATWMIEGFTLYLCMRSIGVEVPLVIAMFGFTFARLFSLVPLTPGSIGQIETGAALFFAAYGYSVDVMVTGTLLYRLITYWPPLVIGVMTYYLAPGPIRTDAAGGPVFASKLHQPRLSL